MKYEHLQNEAIAFEMKLKEEGMLRKKAEEEQRRLAGELVKVHVERENMAVLKILKIIWLS